MGIERAYWISYLYSYQSCDTVLFSSSCQDLLHTLCKFHLCFCLNEYKDKILMEGRSNVVVIAVVHQDYAFLKVLLSTEFFYVW